MPAETPVTIPDVPTVATPVDTELHTPGPPVRSVRLVVAMGHTTSVPVMLPATGEGLIVTTTVAAAVPQLVTTVYDMVEVPAEIPVTTPVALTVATPVDTELHVPPPVASVRFVVVVGQAVRPPVIVPAVGVAVTVTTTVAAAVPQLLVTVYDMVDVPGIIPVTTPVALTVATPVETELHTPPAARSVSAVVPPAGQTVSPPVIAPAFGAGLTVTIAVAAAVPQLLVTVYDMVDVPAATPVTTPVALTVATPVDTELHTPPIAASVKLVVVVGQTTRPPVIVPATGAGLTVTTAVAAAVPQLLVTA